MSANSEFQRTDDELVSLLSQWLMRSLGNDELRKRIEEIGTAELAPGQRTAVDELLVALGNALPGERGDLEMVVRETVESLAYGDCCAPRAPGSSVVRPAGTAVALGGVHGHRQGGWRGRRRSPARATGIRLEVEAPETAGDLAIGDSVAIDGVLPDRRRGGRRAGSPSTRCRRPSRAPRSAASPPESRVNVEPALRAGEPLGGHYVQGHVDGVGVVRSVEDEGDGRRVWIDAPADLLRYAVEKGSIAVHGASLTVAELDDAGFAVALVPHTLEATTLGDLEPASRRQPRGRRAREVRRATAARRAG